MMIKILKITIVTMIVLIMIIVIIEIIIIFIIREKDNDNVGYLLKELSDTLFSKR